MPNFNKDYLQEQHLKGKLTAEEQTEFDQIMESDPDFAREVRAGELAVEGLKSFYVDQRVEAFRKSLDKKGKRPIAKRVPLYRRPLAIAAGFALIIIAAYFIYNSIPGGSLFDQYNQHPTFALTEMSSGPAYDLSRAELAFKQGDYETAGSELAAYLNENPQDTLALLYQGICFLELDGYTRALNIFQAIQSGQSDFQTLGEWYRALTYLKQGNNLQAIAVLENIPSTSEKFTSAQELLEKLKE